MVEGGIQVIHRVSLRNTREPGKVSGAAAKSLVRKVRQIASTARCSLEAKRNVWTGREKKHDEPGEGWRHDILSQHYVRWQEKWGFHPLNPDMAEIERKYRNTRLLWNTRPQDA